MSSFNKPFKKPVPVEVSEITVPPSMPRMGNAFTRWVGRKMMQLTGWRVAGEVPNKPHLVIAAAPHTSNWDFILAMFLVMALGVKFSYLMKKEAFFWPLKGLFMSLGGIPVDRTRGDEVMEQMQNWYSDNSACWVAITPEGTRTSVSKFKTGFLRIAQAVNAPILLVAWDYPTKAFYLLEAPPLTGDIGRDVEIIKEFYDTNFVGRNPL